VTGNSTVTGTLGVTGNSTLGEVNVTGNSKFIALSNNDSSRDIIINGQVATPPTSSPAIVWNNNYYPGIKLLYRCKSWEESYIAFETTGKVGDDNPLITPKITDKALCINTYSGNVGIGTTTPLNKLHIADGDNTMIRIGPDNNVGIGSSTDTSTFGQVRSTYSIAFSGYRNTRTDRIGSKLSSINRQKYDTSLDNQIVQSADLAFYVTNLDVTTDAADATTERMRIKYNGNVGIGYTDPSYPLDVNGQIRGTNLAVTSDRRIKSNIVDVEDDTALQLLRRLKPKTSTSKDTAARGAEPVYGFIAQEVREVLNYSTSITKDALPNIYESARLVDGLLTLTTFNTADLSRDVSGSLFSKVKIKTNDGRDEFVNILEVIDEHTLKVDTTLWSKDKIFNTIN
jgi:hypothetical protein